jgi:hypothetical protein
MPFGSVSFVGVKGVEQARKARMSGECLSGEEGVPIQVLCCIVHRCLETMLPAHTYYEVYFWLGVADLNASRAVVTHV